MPLNIDWQQILLHLLNFTILFAVLYFLMYSPVKKFMKSREDYFKELDEKAQNQLAQAESQRQAYTEKMNTAEAEIAKLKTAAEIEAETIRAKKKELAEQEAAHIIETAKKRGEHEREVIVAEGANEIKQAVQNAAEKLLLHTPDTADVSQVMNQFLDSAERSITNDAN